MAEGFGEAPANLEGVRAHGRTRTTATTYHADDESWWEDVYYWKTPLEDCGDDDDETTCKTQEDWNAAWTEIRG